MLSRTRVAVPGICLLLVKNLSPSLTACSKLKLNPNDKDNDRKGGSTSWMLCTADQPVVSTLIALYA